MKRCLLLLLSLFVLAVPATAGAAITFGAQVGSEFSNQVTGRWSQTRVLKDLNSLYKAGGRVGRSDSNWRNAEPKAPKHGRHTFNWAYDDLMIGELAQAHLRWEPTLAYAPRWAEVHRSNVLHLKSGRFIAYLPPAHNADFATYATAFMKRYGRNGAFWKEKANKGLPYEPVTAVEVWNEPDNSHDWGTDINLSDYVRMYEVVRSAVHRVDRHARVMTGGLAWTESSLPRLLKALRGQPVDAIGIHPYGATPAQSVRVARDALALLSAYGRGRTPVSANEYGWTSTRHTWGSTNPKYVKAYAYQALIGLAKLRLSEIVPMNWGDPSWGLTTGSYANALKKIQHR